MKYRTCNGCVDQFGLCFALLLLFSRTGALLWSDEDGVRRSSLKRSSVDPQLTMRDQSMPRRQRPVTGHRMQADSYHNPNFYRHYSDEQNSVSSPVGFAYPREKCSCNCNNNFGTEGVGAPQCEWRVVFKAVAGSGQNVYSDFKSGGYINGNVPEAMSISSDMPFRDRDILDNWNSLFIKRVKIEVFAKGVSQAWFIFNGIGSNIERWMTGDRLIASSYSGIKEDTFIHFALAGDAAEERRFFISTVEDGDCSTDCGYLLVVDSTDASRTCPYENGDTPYFLVSDTDQCTTWSSEVPGDRFVISARVCDMDW